MADLARIPVVVVEQDRDTCLNVYGVSPCTAGIMDSGTALDGSEDTIQLSSGASSVDDAYNGMTVRITGGTGAGQERRISDYDGATGTVTVQAPWNSGEDPDASSTYAIIDRPNACFNTFKTCQDTDNYLRGTKTFRFCEPLEDMPFDWLADPSVVPGGVSVTPSRINAGGASQSSSALGIRGTISVRFKDHPSSDIRFDPYVTDRTYDPLARGTLWTKWNARDPYFQNRALRAKFGYLGEALASMKTHHFVMDTIEGPGSDGMVTVKGMDVLRLADNNKAQAPALSRGELTADLDAATTSFTVTGATLDEYDSPSGTVRIGDEVITYTDLQGNSDGTLTFSGGERGVEGSDADEHDAEDLVQRCLRYSLDRTIDIIYDLLTTFAGVDHSLIDTAGWESESDRWLGSYELSALITEPEGVAKLIGEICEQVLLFIWWDDREQLIKLQVLRPPIDAPMLLNETANVLEASQSFKVDPDQRISQLWIYFLPKNPAEDLEDPNNYRRARLRVDANAQGANEFGESKVKTIYSRWLRTEAQVTDAATRILARYRDNPLLGSIEVDAKDRDIWTGDLIQLTSRLLVDETGAEDARQFHVISAKETEPGERVRLDLQNFEPRATKQGRYMDNYAPDYLDATDDDLETGAWYSDASGLMSDGEAGWRYQ